MLQGGEELKMNRQSSYQNVVVAVSVLGLLAIACSSTLPMQPANVPAPPGSIIYSSDETGNFEIYHLNVNSFVRTRLTDNSSDDVTPFYFPPAQFGYVSDKTGRNQIYTMGLDGSGQEIWKKDDKYGLFTPGLSPDGAQLVYVVQSTEKSSSLYITGVDGNEEERLTNAPGMAWDPSWSPDGKKIVYSTDAGGDWEIAIVNVSDGKMKALTENKHYDGHPRWSPDGKQILFESDRDGDWEIYVMDANGENVRAITENSSGDWLAAWSPDGKWIVYASNRDGDDEIFIIGLDGKNQRRLTNNFTQDRFPAWVP